MVLGAGALGSLYGAALAEAGCDVTLLCRDDHAAEVRSAGLVVTGVSGTRTLSLGATSDPKALPARPYVAVVAAKAFDVEALLASVEVRPRLAFSIQNGVGKDHPLMAAWGPGTVVGCVSMVGATLKAPGWVEHTMSGTTYLGNLPCGPAKGAEEVADLLQAGGLLVEARPDIEAVVWSKAVLAVAAMGATGLTRLPYHLVFLNNDAAGIFLDLIREAAAVAHAEGVELVDLPGPLQVATLAASPPAQARQLMRRVGEQLVAAGETSIKVSTLAALESGKRTEVAAVHAPILELARKHGLRAPVLETVTRVLSAIDACRGEGRW
ncbi:MAG: putative oxidoreductase YkpB [Acidimicrobiia bacterium]|nr:MAG: putative oxidoreductase YkpB [Acidimicrobiia bacterium]